MMHCGLLRQAIINVLKNAGAKEYAVFRTPKDPNGQPMGDAKKVATICGIYYKDMAKSGRLHIELAGVVFNQSETPKVICVKLSGADILSGDIVAINTRKLEVIDLGVNSGAYTLLVKEVVE